MEEIVDVPKVLALYVSGTYIRHNSYSPSTPMTQISI